MTGRLSVWPPLPLDAHMRRPVAPLPFPLASPGCRVFSRARHALWHGVSAVGLRRGDALLVPAYHHGSEVEALRRLGVRCVFYDLTDDLEPDLPDDPGQVRGLYLIHYLGLAQDVERWRAWCDHRGLLLIEDVAQGWLGARAGTSLGSRGDLAIFCLYKTVGVPDGGAVVGRVPVARPQGAASHSVVPVLRRHGAHLASRVSLVGSLRRRVERPYDPAADFDLGDPDVSAAAATTRLAPRLGRPSVAHRRAANYDYLSQRLPRASGFPEAGEASPFAFPMATHDKSRILSALAERGVEALDLWSVPHPSLQPDEHPRARALRAEVVALPVHQELRRADLERIVAEVERATAGAGARP